MAELVNMKLSDKERKETVEEYKPPEYPWGLELRLTDEDLDKLGISSLPGVGVEVDLSAVAKVTSVSERSTENETDRTLALQITDMALNMSSSDADRAKRIFGDK